MSGAERAALAARVRRGRIVVKIGSGVLTDGDGHLARRTVRRLADDIAPIAGPRRWPFVVSSGAIAVGVGVLGLSARPKTIPGLQAAAAIGQSKLVEAWSAAFGRASIPVAQVLLTHADLAHRARFLNARNALSELQRRRAVPVINENDTVSFEEIAVGDNDGLAADVCNLVEAELLVLVSVAPGLLDPDGRIVDVVRADDPRLDDWVRPEQSKFGKGGMQSKLRAVRKAAARGAHVAIIDGRAAGALPALLAGEPVGSLFVPSDAARRLGSRKHWIGHTLRPSGTVRIDAGAAAALTARKVSLLPKGVMAVEGRFEAGDAVAILGPDGAAIGRGLSRYSADDARRIIGLASRGIAEVLGYTLGPELIHKDDLVLEPSAASA
jgi:glutamate 5-kinase